MRNVKNLACLEKRQSSTAQTQFLAQLPNIMSGKLEVTPQGSQILAVIGPAFKKHMHRWKKSEFKSSSTLPNAMSLFPLFFISIYTKKEEQNGERKRYRQSFLAHKNQWSYKFYSIQ